MGWRKCVRTITPERFNQNSKTAKQKIIITNQQSSCFCFNFREANEQRRADTVKLVICRLLGLYFPPDRSHTS